MKPRSMGDTGYWWKVPKANIDIVVEWLTYISHHYGCIIDHTFMLYVNEGK